MGARITGVAIGAVLLLGGIAWIVLMRGSWLPYGIALLLVLGVIVVALFQPGTLLYATDTVIGHRTILLTRYEVPRRSVATVSVSFLSIEGSPLPTIAFADGTGRCILRSYNANYDTGDLERLAQFAGIEFVP